MKNVLTFMKNKSAARKDKAHGYGRINTSIWHYITPQMIVCIIVPTLIIAYTHTLIFRYFMAGIVLNSVIVTVFVTGISNALLNNYRVYKSAKFLNHLGVVVDAGNVTPEAVQSLLTDLRTNGKLFDTNNMEGNIKNLERFSHPNFTDSDARMIKSKLGQRVAEARKRVTFLGGMLVMLGLIGTYTGLLRTVDTVGAVMLKMSHISDGSGDAMSGFIGALAEPLQGMGLAFSASLFGISGSLLTAIFGIFCNHAQSEFIENVSRWIDDRIPKFAAAAKDGKDKMLGRAASAEDLRTWLAGFVNLSVKTNQKLAQLLTVLSQTSQASIHSARGIDALLTSQKNTQTLIQNMTTSISGMTEQHRLNIDILNQSDRGMLQVRDDIADLKSSAGEIAKAIPFMSQNLLQGITGPISDMSEQQRRTLEVLNQTDRGMLQLRNDISDLKNSAQKVAQAIPQMTQALLGMNGVQKFGDSVQKEILALEHDIRKQSEGISSLGQSLLALPSALTQLNHTQEVLIQRLEKLESPAPRPFNQVAESAPDNTVDFETLLKDVSGDIELFENLFNTDDVQEEEKKEPAHKEA